MGNKPLAVIIIFFVISYSHCLFAQNDFLKDQYFGDHYIDSTGYFVRYNYINNSKAYVGFELILPKKEQIPYFDSLTVKNNKLRQDLLSTLKQLSDSLHIEFTTLNEESSLRLNYYEAKRFFQLLDSPIYLSFIQGYNSEDAYPNINVNDLCNLYNDKENETLLIMRDLALYKDYIYVKDTFLHVSIIKAKFKGKMRYVPDFQYYVNTFGSNVNTDVEDSALICSGEIAGINSNALLKYVIKKRINPIWYEFIKPHNGEIQVYNKTTLEYIKHSYPVFITLSVKRIN